MGVKDSEARAEGLGFREDWRNSKARITGGSCGYEELSIHISLLSIIFPKPSTPNPKP